MRSTLVKSLAGVVALSVLAFTPWSANAADSQGGASMVVLNPGGGETVGGLDGLKIIFNANEAVGPNIGSDNIFFAGDEQWCCGGGGPVLAVGNYAIGEAGAAEYSDEDSWDTIAVSGTTGAFQLVSGEAEITSTAKGNGGVTITYSKTVDGKLYRVVRAVTYVSPNHYFDEDWTVTIPAGNTETVKLYVGGDVAPGDNDNGIGSTQVASGLRTIYEANPDSGQYISYGELDVAEPFTRYFVGDYDAPYAAVVSGGDLPNTTETSEHDAGLQVQWTLGSTAGSYSKSMRTTVSYNTNIPGFVDPERTDLDLNLELAASTGEIVPGSDVLLEGGGLIAMSPLELVLRSTPVNIDLDGQTADASGNFSFPVTLPSPIEPGQHSLTLTGIKPDGSPISDVLYFEIGENGELLWWSTELADTGVDANNFGLIAAGLIAAGGIAVAVRRRKA